MSCVILMLCLFCFFFLMIRRPPRSTRTDTLLPYTTLFRSWRSGVIGASVVTVVIVCSSSLKELHDLLTVGLAQRPCILRPISPCIHPDRKSTRLNSSH